MLGRADEARTALATAHQASGIEPYLREEAEKQAQGLWTHYPVPPDGEAAALLSGDPAVKAHERMRRALRDDAGRLKPDVEKRIRADERRQIEAYRKQARDTAASVSS